MTDEPKNGVTFGWGPAGTSAVAFVDKQGHLALIDRRSASVSLRSSNVCYRPGRRMATTSPFSSTDARTTTSCLSLVHRYAAPVNAC